MKARLKTAVWKSIVGFLFLVLSGSVHAQQLHFTQLGSSEGLPQRTVTCMMQDSRGFLWIGTQEGLCRYDGRAFVVYRQHTADASGLSDDYVWCILEDDKGMLWVGTRHGLNRFDPVREVWINYFHRKDDPSSLSNDWVTDMHEDAEGVLWIATMNGLNRMKTEGSFGRVAFRGTQNGETDSVWCLAGTGDGTLWIGTSGSGLYALRNVETPALSYRNRIDEPASLPSNDVRALETDNSGRLWIGTRSGAAVFQKDTGTFHRLHADGQAPIVTSLCRDGGEGMWAGGYGDGLTHWSAAGMITGQYRHTDDFSGSLSDDLVTSLLRDASGNIWIGTFNGGLNHANPRNLQFHYLRDIGGARAKAADRMVWAVTRDDSGSLWIATDNGIHIRNRSETTWQHIGNKAGDAAAISNERVWCLLADRHGRVWAGTRSGLNCYASDGKTVRRLPIPGDPLRNRRVYTLFESANGTIWIGTDEGLFALDFRSGAMLPFLQQVKNAYSLGNATGAQAVKPWCIAEGKDGSIWVGTENNGLMRLNPSDGSYVRYEKRPGGLSSNRITCIVQGDDDALWLGTMGGGLNRLDLRHKRITHLSENDGLANNTVYGILRDAQGHLWMSTNQGLSVYDRNSRRFTNFRFSDGLQAEEFNQGAYAQTADGWMYFGGGQGLNSFRPEEIRLNTYSPPVVITSMRAQSPGRNAASVAWSGDTTATLEFPYHQNFITLEFAALEFSDPARNRYTWRLEGLHDSWIDTTTVNSAIFTGLPPGKYTFTVRAANNHGSWNESGASISFVVLPPWWGTWWFRLLVLVVVAAVVLLLFRARLRAVQLRNRTLEAQVHQRTQELQARSQELKANNESLEESLDTLRNTQMKLTYASKMASLGQLTAGIAHEIKNPINFVNNFAFSSVDIAEELKEELEKTSDEEVPLAARITPLLDELVTNANKISEHGGRVDRIVQSMLLHSHGKAAEAEPVPLNEFLDQYVSLAFHGMRAQVQNFTVTIDRVYDETIERLPLIRQDVARVFVNLLNNAFQAVSDKQDEGVPGYDPIVRVSTRRDGDRAMVTIEDNGPGVPEHLREKIFEPFFTTKSAGSGTGLGLSLSYEVVVEGHGGELKYETSELGGARFILVFPM